MKIPIALALALILGRVATAQDPRPSPSLFPAGYPDQDAMTETLGKFVTAYPDVVRVRSIAKSAGGRDVWLATLGKADRTRPAILIVANLEADHVVGSAVALELIDAMARTIAAADPKTADAPTIYIVPRLNPDGAESVLKGQPRSSFRLNLSPVDRDRDGKMNEDGPDDLDGDGLATRMRIKDASAAYLPDEKDPRLLRKADPAKGERGVVSEYGEGFDNDGDGVVNEDPPGGVNLDRHWPFNWTEFDPEAGFSPCSEPECRALIEFAFAHPEIAAVWTFTLKDSLKVEPKKPGSTLDDADLPLVAELSRRFNALVKVDVNGTTAVPAPSIVPASRPAVIAAPKGVRPRVATSPPPPSFDGTTDGAMSEWAYHQFGVIGISSRLWASPEIPDPPKGQPSPPADGDERWLFWNDKVMGGRAFVPFRPFEHPELGPVEVGGWKPGVRINPPFERVGAISQAHLAFLKDLAGRLPRLDLRDPHASSRGGNVYEISATVVNDGYLPTAIAQGIKTRNAAPILVKIKAPGAKLLAGRPTERIESLAGSGGSHGVKWLVLVPDGTKTLTIEAACPKAGRVEKVIELK